MCDNNTTTKIFKDFRACNIYNHTLTHTYTMSFFFVLFIQDFYKHRSQYFYFANIDKALDKLSILRDKHQYSQTGYPHISLQKYVLDTRTQQYLYNKEYTIEELL